MHRRRPATDEVVVEVVAEAGAGFSGIVVEAGATAWLAIGDEVFGTTPADRAPGPRVVCGALALARKPTALAHPEAAVLAAVGPAALAAIRLSGVRPGDRVMVTGAGDDAGAITVQIAKVRGGHVTAVCRDRDVPFVWELGADEVLAREREAGTLARFVAVIDTDRTVTRALATRLLEPDGRLIAIHHGAVQVSTADGGLIASWRASAGVAPRELVELVERDHVFPVPLRPYPRR